MSWLGRSTPALSTPSTRSPTWKSGYPTINPFFRSGQGIDLVSRLIFSLRISRRSAERYSAWKGVADREKNSDYLFTDVEYQRRDVSSLAALAAVVGDCLDDNWDYRGHGATQKLGFCFVYDLVSGGLTLPSGVDPRRLGRFIVHSMIWSADASRDGYRIYTMKRLFFLFSYLHDNPAAKWPRMTLDLSSSREEKVQAFAAIFAVCNTLAAKEAKAGARTAAKPTPPLKYEMNRSRLARTFNQRCVHRAWLPRPGQVAPSRALCWAFLAGTRRLIWC